MFKSLKIVDKILFVVNYVIDGKGVEVFLVFKIVLRFGEILGVKYVYLGEKEERKIFVFGLKIGVYGIIDNDLKEYFFVFGDVEEVKMVVFKSYGFVIFKVLESVIEVLLKGLYLIGGWKINVEQFFRVEEKIEIIRKGKRVVNVYNVLFEIFDDEMVSYFLRFGEVEKVLGRDKDNIYGSQCIVVFKIEYVIKMVLEK